MHRQKLLNFKQQVKSELLLFLPLKRLSWSQQLFRFINILN